MFEASLPQTTGLWQRAAPGGNHLYQRQGSGGLRQADTDGNKRERKKQPVLRKFVLLYP